MKKLIFLAIAATCFVLAFTVPMAATGCKGAQAPTPAQIEAGAPAAETGCVTLQAFDSSGVLQTVCELLPDILAAAEVVVPLFAVKSGETCETVGPPGSALCLTNAQRLTIIRKLHAPDGGHK